MEIEYVRIGRMKENTNEEKGEETFCSCFTILQPAHITNSVIYRIRFKKTEYDTQITHSHVLPALIRRFHEAKESGAASLMC